MSPVSIGLDEFEGLVTDAMDDVPDPFAAALDQVALIVEEHAPGRNLYGLYTGVPLVAGTAPSGTMPPRITIYMHPLADHCHDLAQLRNQVRVTVLHELGHHLGLDEDRLQELGYA